MMSFLIFTNLENQGNLTENSRDIIIQINYFSKNGYL